MLQTCKAYIEFAMQYAIQYDVIVLISCIIYGVYKLMMTFRYLKPILLDECISLHFHSGFQMKAPQLAIND